MALLVVGLLAAAVGGYAWWQRSQARARERARAAAAEAAGAYLAAWEARDVDRMRSLSVDPPDGFDDLHRATVEALGVQAVEVDAGTATLVDPGSIAAGATVPYSATLHLAGLGQWSYDATVPLVPVGEGEDRRWRVDWSPAVLHPALDDGERLDRVREWPSRAPILGHDGRALDPAGIGLELVVGRTGEVTAELLQRLGEPYRPGDMVGLGGLQLAFERRLAGSPSGDVRVVDAQGQVVEVLHRFPGEQPAPLRTTLDPDAQRAAAGALATASSPSAMVVVDASTSEIRAVVNRPDSGFNRAFSGRYPPGSAFKVVTTTAVLRAGVTPETVVSCPERAVVHGRPFRNFEGEAFGDIPFREAFYRSCNTAFVQLAADLEDGALDAAAADYGFDSGWSLPVGEPVARFPEPRDLAERAAAAIGQARVEASPVHLASVAAAVGQGRWRSPTLLADADPTVAPDGLDLVADTIAALMREVPRRGTAEGAGLPEGVAGKTGTAEYGTGAPLPTHALFIGFRSDGAGPQRDVAFAVVVEGGSSGGAVAAPVAARFLAALP
ncbi:MAG TPA: penicillin-binding transpeptidase domain-containing protein [Nitriliruptorales bacterium]|nr:penicillin-binding transpeptidase domain-containing protein [Nitriliruptorales bacterium]